MTIRKLTLEEWFTRHQLRAIARRHVHLPIAMSVDVSATVRHYAAQSARPPWTALVVQAAAQVARQVPEANRLLFDTLLGPRLVEPPYVAVNVPVILLHEGKPHLSAVVLREPGTKSLAEVQAELRAARDKRLADQPIGRLYIDGRNTLLRRLRLRLVHWAVWHLPSLYLRHGGGGISVSSLMLHSRPELRIWAPSYGPTALTICVTGLNHHGDGATLQLGVGFDHLALSGERAAAAVVLLSELLARPPVDVAAGLGEKDSP